ncbi:MAG: hypothetical protein HY043_19240 [Verrucomicrobia bacterium]|nr:hypothetical protein [Verrucomicrobiota bacterium]
MRLAAPRGFDLHLHINFSKASAIMYAANLTEANVDYNKDDVTGVMTFGG